jgi:hypothetical protein
MHAGPVRFLDPPMAAFAAPAGAERRLKRLVVHASGKGQDRPAPSTRFNVSRTVERARPSRRAISCVDTDEDFSRIISRASRIPIRSAGIDCFFGVAKGATLRTIVGAPIIAQKPVRALTWRKEYDPYIVRRPEA